MGIQAKNCAKWFITDLAIMMSGHISVPLYPGQSPQNLHYIIGHADISIMFAGRLESRAVVQETIIWN
ncbi:hypothetical protein E1189_09400 [Sansalvadorimonas verongulae]|nr:hypothetical protein [Sansalvadorimonas verongulae]